MTALATQTIGNLDAYLESFQRHLRLRNRAPRTIETYVESTGYFLAFLTERDMPLEGARLRRDHVEAWIESLQDRGLRPATVAQRYRSVQQFMNYLVDEGELRESPMAKMHVPAIPERLVPVIPDEAVAALLKACKPADARDFRGLRDTAMIRLFLDTGVRLSEMTRFAVEDVSLRHNSALVYMGKGRKPRQVSFGDAAAQALERYLRARKKHPKATAALPEEDGQPRGLALWIAQKGPLQDSGIAQMVKNRSAEAGIPHINPHRFRHTAAHNMAEAGMNETDLMRLFGWDSSQMPKLYGKSAGTERAQAAYRRLGIGDRY